MDNLAVRELQYKIEDLSREINRMVERFKDETGYYPKVENTKYVNVRAEGLVFNERDRIKVTVEIK